MREKKTHEHLHKKNINVLIIFKSTEQTNCFLTVEMYEMLLSDTHCCRPPSGQLVGGK